MIKKLFLTALMAVMVINILPGCGKQVEAERDSAFYQNLGDQYKSRRNYKQAIKSYEEALMRAENPEEASKIQLALADAYFFYKEYNEAIPVYETYVDVYGEHPSADLAYIRLGLSHFELINRTGRDQTDAVAAKGYFEKVKARNPDLFQRYGLNSKIQQIRTRLAEKEIVIAKYYTRILERDPAILRYKYVTENYADTKFYPEAVYRMAKLLIKEGRNDEASAYVTVLKMKQPNDEYTKDAVNLLKDK